MSVLSELLEQRRIYVRCPTCEGEFPLAEAQPFDATRKLPSQALEVLAQKAEDLVARRAELRAKKLKAPQRSQTAARSVNIGKVVEKLAPSLPGFPVSYRDCRSLFDPIDYIAFSGLALHGVVDALYFVEVKSGAARLTAAQRRIKA